MKTIVLYNVEEHTADLLKEVVTDFVKRHRDDETAELNNLHIGETKLVELEELIDSLYVNDLDDLEEDEVRELLDGVDKDHILSWLEDKIST